MGQAKKVTTLFSRAQKGEIFDNLFVEVVTGDG